MTDPDPHDDAPRPDGSAHHGGSHPERIGRYRILGVLGEGGMGVVYRAEQEHPAREVALKVIRPDRAAGTTLRRFAFEAEVLGRLAHPGIAHVYDAGSVDVRGVPTPYLAMELVIGEPLDVWARDRSPRDVVALMAQVCDAVEAAHRADVIHRDLKPGNVLVTADGQPKVLDFGLAAATDADLLVTTMHTRTGEIMGTVPFMSPEQAAGEPQGIDVRTDVYALGVVLHALLVGELPYDLPPHSLLDALRTIRESDPVRLGSVRRDLRGDIETIVLKALEKEKGRRYGSAAALAADLRAHLEARPISARPASTLYQIRKFTRRNRALVAGATATFLALVAGLVVSIHYGLGEAQQRREADRANERLGRANDELAAANDQLGLTNDQLAATNTELTAVNRRLSRVSEYQGTIFRWMNGRLMGEDLIARLRDAVSASRDGDADAVARDLARFDQLVQGIDAAGVVSSVIATGLVGAASRRVVPEFGAVSLESAMLLTGLAKAYTDLGQAVEAEAEVERALDALPDDASELHRVTLEAERVYAWQMQGRFDEIEPEARRLTEELERLSPNHHDAFELTSMRIIGLAKLGKAEDAVALADAWVPRLEGRTATNDGQRALLSHAAQVYVGAGRVDDAERVLLQRGDFDEGSGAGRLEAQQLDTVANLAYLREGQGRLEDAEALYRRVVQGQIALNGGSHPELAVALNNLAYCLLQQGEHQESAELMGRAIAIAFDTVGPTHANTGLFVHTLGEILLAGGRHADALERLDEAVGLYRQAANTRFVAAAMVQAAGACAQLGRVDEAFQRLDQAADQPGFAPAMAQGDEFAPLRDDPRFGRFGG